MKKDILAAITFLVTGLLFYMIQTGGTAEKLLSSEMECGSSETVLMGKTTPESPLSVSFDGGVTRDS